MTPAQLALFILMMMFHLIINMKAGIRELLPLDLRVGLCGFCVPL